MAEPCFDTDDHIVSGDPVDEGEDGIGLSEGDPISERFDGEDSARGCQFRSKLVELAGIKVMEKERGNDQFVGEVLLSQVEDILLLPRDGW